MSQRSNDTFSLRNLQEGLSDVFAHHLYDRLSPKDLWSLYATDTKFRDDLNNDARFAWLLNMCRNRSWAHCEGLLCEEAARIGDLGRLKWAHEHGCPWDEDTCVYAACNGHLECLKYAHMNGCPWDEDTCKYAACNDHLECLTYAHTEGCPWDELTCQEAAGNGHLECLKYAHMNGCTWSAWAPRVATRNGHLECLRYLHEKGPPLKLTGLTKTAASNGHLECLKYLHIIKCPWDVWTCHFAARNGHLECLEYALENGCPRLVSDEQLRAECMSRRAESWL
jgi:hypothetical protein